jgi:hypothetical protein
MGIINFIKNLFSKKTTNSVEKVNVETKPEVVITNLGVGSDDKPTDISIDEIGIQTTFNTSTIDILVEEGEIENVSD